MAKGARHARGTGFISGAAVAGVAVLAGILFSTSARLSEAEERGNPNLRTLVAEQDAEVSALLGDNAELAGEIDALVSQVQGEAEVTPDPTLALAAGRTSVTGPGLVIELNDAKAPPKLPSGIGADALIVHQQDIEGVVNALWAGGAEAISLQGQRLTTVSAIRCVGNVLYISGLTESPPYSIAAIGPVDAMRAAVEEAAPVQAYLWAVDNLGLGWSVRVEQNLRIDGYPGGSIGLRHAAIIAAEPK